VSDYPDAVSHPRGWARGTGSRTSPTVIPTDAKVRLIDALARHRAAPAGGDELRAAPTSSPSSPMRRGNVLQAIDVPDEVDVSVLIPNERGPRQRAALPRPTSTRSTASLSASETHNRRNVKPFDRGVADRDRARAGTPAREAGGCGCEGVISVAVRLSRTRATCRRSACSPSRGACAMPARTRSRSATPPAWPIRARSAASSTPRAGAGRRRAHGPLPQHARPGPGQRARGARAGIDSFESSFGELGGCPVPPGSTGNMRRRTWSRCSTRWHRDRDLARAPARSVQRGPRCAWAARWGRMCLHAGPVSWHESRASVRSRLATSVRLVSGSRSGAWPEFRPVERRLIAGGACLATGSGRRRRRRRRRSQRRRRLGDGVRIAS
jgi:hydroxymethylglutaryl-CoA lyase